MRGNPNGSGFLGDSIERLGVQFLGVLGLGVYGLGGKSMPAIWDSDFRPRTPLVFQVWGLGLRIWFGPELGWDFHVMNPFPLRALILGALLS